MKVLAIIPARGGSKEIPKKNIKLLDSKPLIAWTIIEAKKTKLITRVIVSTDSQEIAEIAKSYKAEIPFLRPSEISRDETPGVQTALHAINQLPYYEWVLFLQPTSPFRSYEDIEGIISFARKKNINSVVSVNEIKVNPYIIFEKDNKHKLTPIASDKKVFNRQELNQYYKINGALYLCKTSWLLKNKEFISKETYGYEMPIERSLDIDSMEDWEKAEKQARLLI